MLVAALVGSFVLGWLVSYIVNVPDPPVVRLPKRDGLERDREVLARDGRNVQADLQRALDRYRDEQSRQ